MTDLLTLKPEFEKFLKETHPDRFMRLARKIVSEEDWESFVFSAMIFGDLKRKYPQYLREIKKMWKQ